MKVAAGTIKSLGLCDDKNYVTLRIAAESGELVALEFPTTLLPELSIIAVQLATKSSEKTGSNLIRRVCQSQMVGAGGPGNRRYCFET